jgi:DNA-binding transcriptional regulator YiaG
MRKVLKKEAPYHYSECGLDNIYLSNGFEFIKTPRGRAVSINNIDGLHKAIGKFLITSKKELNGEDIRFLRHELLMSQKTLAHLLGVTEQSVLRWENGKTTIPKPSETLLRLLYHDHLHNRENSLSRMLKAIANMENELSETPIYFKDTNKGWIIAA